MTQGYTSTGGYPPAAFYFEVVFVGEPGMDAAFQDVSGIKAEMEFEDVEEGGENRFKYRLPKSVKHSELVLKRGMADKASPLVQWCEDVLLKYKFPIETKDIEVHLLGYDEKTKDTKTISGWSFGNVYPVKWEIDGFKSEENKVAIETISFVYNDLNRIV